MPVIDRAQKGVKRDLIKNKLMVRIRKLQKRDTEAVARLVFDTFRKFNSGDHFDKRGVQKYLDMYDIKKREVEDIYRSFKKSSIFYVAVEGDRIVGMIRGRPDQLINLYVQEEFHGRGIARKLVERFETEAKRGEVEEIKIRSSVYAMPFYEKMGYKKTTGMRNLRGIKIYPMKKNLK